MRDRCNVCSSTDLVHTQAIDLPWRSLPTSMHAPDMRTSPFGEFLPGAEVDPGALADRKLPWRAISWAGPAAPAWFCNGCGAWGVWAPKERVL